MVSERCPWCNGGRFFGWSKYVCGSVSNADYQEQSDKCKLICFEREHNKLVVENDNLKQKLEELQNEINVLKDCVSVDS